MFFWNTTARTVDFRISKDCWKVILVTILDVFGLSKKYSVNRLNSWLYVDKILFMNLWHKTVQRFKVEKTSWNIYSFSACQYSLVGIYHDREARTEELVWLFQHQISMFSIVICHVFVPDCSWCNTSKCRINFVWCIFI